MDGHEDVQQRNDRLSQAWRHRMGMQPAAGQGGKGDPPGGGLESAEAVGGDPPAERIRLAREAMLRTVKERFGGDPALLESVQALILTSQDAIKVLEAAQREPTPDEYSSLEAVVAFDGTRPSFLIRDGEVDLASSFSTGPWKTTLAPALEQIAAFASCVGRVEKGEAGIGTAFLVSPTLALTNRHVAQSIARFDGAGIELHQNIFLDFGWEHDARGSFDRRSVVKVLFAGAELVAPPIVHGKLDLALLQVTPSALGGPDRHRMLKLQPERTDIAAGLIVATAGYPSRWQQYVPAAFVAQHEAVLAKLLEGDAGSKRFAPGESAGMLAADPGGLARGLMHDATTINGNSGSPLTLLAGGAAALRVAGLHYGGQWHGQRTNWAHLLAACGDSPVTGGKTLRAALAEYGVTL